MGLQEHLPENVRLEGTDRLDYRIFCCKNSNLEIFQLLKPIDEYATWHADICHRMAKNPMKFVKVSVFISNKLGICDCPGRKVMFCARPLTVHFPAIAPGTPE
jgi:hypothetical protein